jgi:hypothetical protein
MGGYVPGDPASIPPGTPTSDLTWKDYVALGAGVAAGEITGSSQVANWTAKHATQVSGYSLVWGIIVAVVDEILLKGVELITKLQGQDNPGFYDLMQGLLSDTLGIEFPEGAIESAWHRGGSMAAIKTGGALLLNQLASEMATTLPAPAGPGLSAAQGLLGFIIAFSVREANVSTFMSLIPEEYRFLEGIRDYAVDLAQNLGLGRICRQALMPILRQWIQDPLTRELNAQYHPTKLGSGPAIKAHNRGMLTDQELADEISWEGYTDRYAQALQKDALTQLPVSDAFELFKAGRYTSQQLTTAYQMAGFDFSVSGDWLAAQIQKEIDPWVTALVTDWKTQLAGGYIKLADFDDNIDGLGIYPDVAKAIKTAVGTLYEFPRKKLTLPEVQSAIVEGILTFDDLDAWLQGEGYSSDDRDTLTQMTLLKLGTQAAKVQVAEYTWAKAKAAAAKKGEPEPPPPAILTSS